MKLAKLIAEEHYRGSGKAYDMSRGMLENIVAAKLEPVKDLLKRIKSDVVCEGVTLTVVDGYDAECSPKMALSSIGEMAIEALALFEEGS